jgi:predicted acetyltransferase
MLLIEPTMDYDKQIQAFRKEFLNAGDMDGSSHLRKYAKTEDWINHTIEYKSSESPNGFVKTSQYIYVREKDKKVIGVLQIRHHLNEMLEKYAGYIGYSICPSERKKGYGTAMLKAALPICKELGIKNLLIACIEGNEASKKVILKNGGVYENTIYWEERNSNIERYWIDLTKIE